MLSYGVITICLNSDRTIYRTIESVLKQSVLPHEYIFVDGGSSDSTIEIIDSTMKNFEFKNKIKWKIIRQKTDGGIPEAWNIALNEINTEIICILNSDDWYEDKVAEQVLRFFKNNHNTGILLANSRCFSAKNHIDNFILKPKPLFLFPVLMPVVHPSCFVRKDVYNKIGVFNNYKVSADYDFLYRSYKAGIGIKNINKIFTNVELGGYASINKEIARKETLKAGIVNSKYKIFPILIYFIRKILSR